MQLMCNKNNNLFKRAYDCILIKDPTKKTVATHLLFDEWQHKKLTASPLQTINSIPVPGRPDRPSLVDPKLVPRRNFNTQQGQLSLVHAIAHIEFNAINLALDAVYRFQNMPKQYYTDWCRVAAEETDHFELLSDYLTDHGMRYGDQDAHNGLWEMAVKTDSDVLIRMALVPRVLEARGLDVTPTMLKKLRAINNQRLVDILQKIFDEEIGHVKIGSYWYNTLCAERNLEPLETFIRLIDQYMKGAKFGPFESEARIKAGFTKNEMQQLMAYFR